MSQLVKDDLQKIKVSKNDAAITQKRLDEELFDKWVEGVEVTKASGIPVDQINGYLDHLQDAYEGIDDEMRKHMDAIDWTEEWTSKIFEFKYNDKHEKGVRFGMITFGKSPDNKMVDCIVSLYKMDFKIAPNITEKMTNHSALFGLIRWETRETEVVQRTFSTETMKSLENFFRVKTLEGLQKEGVIDTIADVVSVPDNGDKAQVRDTGHSSDNPDRSRSDESRGEL